MNRFVSLFLSAMLALSLLSYPVYADTVKTDRRGSIEFAELFVSRFDELKYNGEADFDLYISKDQYPTKSGSGKIYYFESAAGTLWLDAGDMSVVGVDMTLSMDNDSAEENLKNEIKCIVGISVLECNQAEDSALRIGAKMQNGPESAFDIGMNVYDQIIYRINSGVLKQATDTKNQILVYSGNYDYYVSYYVSDRPDGAKIGLTNLHAESRQ